MKERGYYRYPTIYKEQIVFVSEGDLWSVTRQDPIARRLSFNRGEIKSPVFSPKGDYLAFSSSDEGNSEVYVMSSTGGEMRRLTYLGDQVTVLGWDEDGIIFSTSVDAAFQRINQIYRVDPKGGLPERIPVGPANFISYGKALDGKKSCAIQRHGYREYGYWKRYRGGTAGDVWVDQLGKGQFKKLISLKGDLSRPLIIQNRVYFTSDHDGIGNLYSCDLKGKDLRQETFHQDFYVRNQSTDGQNIVYHAGGDLYCFNVQKRESKPVEITYYSARPGRSRKFVSSAKYLQSYHLHPRGSFLTLLSRGKAFFFSNWEGPVIPLANKEGARYRFPVWLHDGQRICVITDDCGEESLEIYDARSGEMISKPKKPIQIGRAVTMVPSPNGDYVLITNHANEFVLVDLKKWKTTIIDRSVHGLPGHFEWSPDGAWIAYSTTLNLRQRVIKLFEVKTGKSHMITPPLLRDDFPTFDPDGKYLYFLSWRTFDPSWDSLQFDLSFQFSVKAYAICLQKDLTNPFLKKPEEFVCPKSEDKKEKKEDKKSKGTTSCKIDLEGIEHRIVEFPIQAGDYSQLQAAKGKVYFLSHALEPAGRPAAGDEPDADTTLEVFDLESLKQETVVGGVSAFHFSADRETMVYRVQRQLRVLKVGDKGEDERSYTRKTGWIDLDRVNVSVNPVFEWEQMYGEAWRLQRDHFWTSDMSEVDWEKVRKRYEPLLNRIATREEFSDILWEMQGELGTSHAYVYGGDLKASPRWILGYLGAQFTYDTKKNAYRITAMLEGDRWATGISSPLLQPGLNLSAGDYLLAINKQPLTALTPPGALLMNLVDQEIELDVADSKLKNRRCVIVKTLSDPYQLRYREWVEKNRAYVHTQTKGRVGYIHIPDMSADGFAEFHRSFLQELDREGLVVDVRFNGGGSVSPLILEKLARRRHGYDVTRWSGIVPYPMDAPLGPMVALTNEYAGSDGDMFSHTFKKMKLGPLLGKRTWGGIIGIYPRYGLVDGGITTQPEYSFWFKDIGWSIENYGVDPDIEVEITPQDYEAGKDPQLDRAIAEVLKIQAETEEQFPNLMTKPSLRLPF